jgi:hypothetical protein
MIEVSVNEVATGVLTGAIGSAGRWLAVAATGPRGRRAEDLSIARWFETYKLTDRAPALPGLSPNWPNASPRSSAATTFRPRCKRCSPPGSRMLPRRRRRGHMRCSA